MSFTGNLGVTHGGIFIAYSHDDIYFYFYFKNNVITRSSKVNRCCTPTCTCLSASAAKPV
jgi:hypothetical protein